MSYSQFYNLRTLVLVLGDFFFLFNFQATRSDRIYVNTPDAPKSDGGNVQILSFSQSSKAGEESGAENKGMAKDEIHSDDDDEEEDALTPGDLLAFAWQISEGMVRILHVWPCEHIHGANFKLS